MDPLPVASNEESRTLPPKILTLELLPRLGGWKAAKEGKHLFELGKVKTFAFRPPLLEGKVATPSGTILARLKTGMREVEFENLCTCREARSTGVICPHVLAVAYAWLAHKDGDAPREATDRAKPELTSGAPVNPPIKRLARRSLQQAGGDLIPLTLRLLLPLRLEQLAQRDGVQVYLEGSIDGEVFRPFQTLEAALQDRDVVLETADEQLVSFIEETLGHALSHVMPVPSEKVDLLLLALRGHPRVWRGAKERVNIQAEEVRPHLCLWAEPPDQIVTKVLHSEPPGIRIGNWFLEGTTLVRALPVAALEKWAGVHRGNAAVHFLTKGLPELEQLCRIEVDRSFFDLIRVEERKPAFRLELEGTLQGLHGALNALYGETAVPLHAPHKEAASLLPDQRVEMTFWRRDHQSEKDALERLAAYGFLPSKKDPQLFVLHGEALTTAFLASGLRELQRIWQIIPKSRLAQLLDSAVWAEPVLRMEASQVDWLNVEIAFGEETAGVALGYNEVLELVERGRSAVHQQDGRLVFVDRQKVRELGELLQDFDAHQVRPGHARFSKRNEWTLGAALAEGGIRLSSHSSWQPPNELREERPITLPEDLVPLLRGYQVDGVRWLMRLTENGFCGILADEMGLGKTLQTLTWLRLLRSANPEACFLVVAPTSLLYNWRSEATRFAPELEVGLYHGTTREHLLDAKNRPALWITSYAVARKDITLLAELTFETIVLDEAHQIKNPESQVAQAARQLKAKTRLALTGTPIENRPTDLWSLFHFLMPGFLGSQRDFQIRYEKRSGDESEGLRRRLARRVKPFILRRTKREVAPELPSLVEHLLPCVLTDEQTTVYRNILESAKRRISELSTENERSRRRMTILQTLLRLRQVCCHLDLLPGERKAPWKEPSGKVAAWLELLEEARENDQRMLVFSQFTSMLALLRAQLEQESIPFSYLDGATRDRAGVVRQFQEDQKIPVFLISLKAGGTGLNLTAADHVVLFDPWWNPAVEEQAAARAHRIGRTGMVMVHRLVAVGTIEERMLELKAQKRDLAGELLEGEGLAGGLTDQDLQELLS